jgi:hypothetical protein
MAFSLHRFKLFSDEARREREFYDARGIPPPRAAGSK